VEGMKNKLRKELNPLNSLIKEQRRAIDALKNPWGDVAKTANPAYFFLEEQRKLKESLSDPFKEMRKMARIDSAFLNTSQIYKELTCSAVHLEALSNPLAGYMQALAEALQSATRLVGVDNLSQYFSDMEHRITLLDKDYLKDLIYPMSRIEEYSQSLSNTLFNNNDLLNVTSFFSNSRH
jgi:cysteinyl-tRNA synthetase